MRRFEYIRPASLSDATSFLAGNAEESLVIGGGTAAVVLLDMGILRPRYVVDLGGLSELRGVRNGSGLEIGALTSIRTLERDPLVRERYGLLTEAASQVANVRVRNMATVGGTISYGEPQTDTPCAKPSSRQCRGL
jgi:aerobic carbon-monoxide dehydrogenase medium subunit